MFSRLTGLGMFRYRRRLAFAAYLLCSPLKDYMETKIFCCFGFAVIFSLWQIRVMQTDCPMKPLDRLNCTKKKRDARERFCFAKHWRNRASF